MRLITCLLLLSAGMAAAATSTNYVVKNNPGAESPFTSWDTAASNIQSALAVAPPDGLVLVSNGVYDSSFALSADTYTNRIVVPDARTVQSVNGPEFAILQGGAGIRCAALAGSARLVGFSLTGAQGVGGVWGEGGSAEIENGWIHGNSALRGGGAQGVTLVNCRLKGNTATLRGGGAYDCFLRDCMLVGNSAENGGGASSSVLWNSTAVSNNASEAGGGVYDSVLRGCLVAENSADQGGGTYGGALYNTTVSDNRAITVGGGTFDGELFNCVVYDNALFGETPDNWTGSLMQFSCSTPLPAGIGNTEDNPMFVDPGAGNFRLGDGSPCIDVGTNQDWMAMATDLDGTPRIVNEIVDMGAYEYATPPLPDPQLVVLSPDGAPIDNGAEPDVGAGTVWVTRAGYAAARTFGLTNAGNATVALAGAAFSGPGAASFSTPDFPLFLEPGASHSFLVIFQPGAEQLYEATLEIVHSASNTPSPFALNVRGEGVPPANRYVVAENPMATAPYTNWPTAAPDIQSAIAVSRADDTIWVSNGVYATGEVAGFGDAARRVSVTNAIVVRSVNGPGATIIQGDSGIRCAYLGVKASLIGFTLTNGLGAGGVWCADETAVVSNCVVTGNSAPAGGGVLGGTIRNCVISGNSADSGGGAFNAQLIDCELTGNAAELGGGAFDSQLRNCLLSGNAATESGGGAHGSVLQNCTLRENDAHGNFGGGGGVAESTLQSCLLLDNTATYGGGSRGGFLNNCTLVGNAASAEGGGAYEGALQNCIVYFNRQGLVEDNIHSSATASFCCSTPLPIGPGNIDADPGFADRENADFRLKTNSPCINSGSNETWMEGSLDLGGNPRAVGPAVDMGAFEHPFTPSGIDAAWLQRYFLALDGSDDFENADIDGMNNWKEWRCGTDPKDPLSLLSMERSSDSRPPDGIGWIIRWQSVTGKVYAIERATHLPDVPSFLPLAGSINGQAGFTTYTDRTATAIGPYIYRVILP